MKYDMNEYKDKLASLNLVQEKYIPYMAGWVKHFLVLGNPDAAVFADILSREGREDWQIRQALDAVKIYRGIYPEDSTRIETNSVEPMQIMRDSLKVRHYARSTEKAYLQWCAHAG